MSPRFVPVPPSVSAPLFPIARRLGVFGLPAFGRSPWGFRFARPGWFGAGLRFALAAFLLGFCVRVSLPSRFGFEVSVSARS